MNNDHHTNRLRRRLIAGSAGAALGGLSRTAFAQGTSELPSPTASATSSPTPRSGR